jgi:DNA-binding phage protein
MAKPKKAEVIVRKARAQIFANLVSLIDQYDLASLAREAEVSHQTLWNWLYGTTYNPHINTMIKVANAVGYDIALRKRASTGLRKVL